MYLTRANSYLYSNYNQRGAAESLPSPASNLAEWVVTKYNISAAIRQAALYSYEFSVTSKNPMEKQLHMQSTALEAMIFFFFLLCLDRNWINVYLGFFGSFKVMNGGRDQGVAIVPFYEAELKFSLLCPHACCSKHSVPGSSSASGASGHLWSCSKPSSPPRHSGLIHVIYWVQCGYEPCRVLALL